VVAGIDAMSKLAPQFRDALYGSINEALDHYIANYNSTAINGWNAGLKQRDIDNIVLSDTQINAFRSRVARPAATAWIEDNTNLGLPAQELYDFVMDTLFGGDREIGSDNTEWSLAEEASTAVVETTYSVLTVNDGNNYLGPPRGSTRAAALTTDPLQYLVEWDLQVGEVSVGAALQRLANYIGYELVRGNEATQDNYQRILPRVQRSVAEITVGDGFEVLSGPGFVTVFNHSARSVTHLPKRNRQVRQNLPACPETIDIASQSADGVLLLSDGSECRY